MQSADEEYVATTAAVTMMVFPVKGTVKDIAVGSSTRAVDMHVMSAVFTLRTSDLQSPNDSRWHITR